MTIDDQTYLSAWRQQGYLRLPRRTYRLLALWRADCAARGVPYIAVTGGRRTTIDAQHADWVPSVGGDLAELERLCVLAGARLHYARGAVAVYQLPAAAVDAVLAVIMQQMSRDAEPPPRHRAPAMAASSVAAPQVPPARLRRVRELVALWPELARRQIELRDWPDGRYILFCALGATPEIRRAIARHCVELRRWISLPPADHLGERCPTCGSRDRWDGVDGREMCRPCIMYGLAPLTIGRAACCQPQGQGGQR